MSKPEGRRIAIEFTMPIIEDVTGNESAFTITGQEYKYVNGPNNNGEITNVNYNADSIEHNEINPNKIVLIFNYPGTFQNTIGEINLKYTQSLGSLIGTGGAVENFEEVFIPVGLEEKHRNIGLTDKYTTAINGMITRNKIVFYEEHIQEHYNAAITGTVSLYEVKNAPV